MIKLSYLSYRRFWKIFKVEPLHPILPSMISTEIPQIRNHRNRNRNRKIVITEIRIGKSGTTSEIPIPKRMSERKSSRTTVKSLLLMLLLLLLMLLLLLSLMLLLTVKSFLRPGRPQTAATAAAVTCYRCTQFKIWGGGFGGGCSNFCPKSERGGGGGSQGF
jgi:hypothetical protein